MGVNPHGSSFDPDLTSVTGFGGYVAPARIRVTEYNPAWNCECGAVMMAHWSDIEHTKRHLECPREVCPHHGKRFAIPTVELTEIVSPPVDKSE